MTHASPDPAEHFLKRALLVGAAVLVVTIAVGMLLSSRLRNSAPPPPPATPASSAGAPASDTISILIDFPDGFQKRYSALPCPAAGMTVLEALRAAADRPRGPVIAVSGSGDAAFLSAIDNLASEGSSGAGRNWQFWINDRFATVGIGSATLRRGDRLTWAFRPWEQDPKPPVFTDSP